MSVTQGKQRQSCALETGRVHFGFAFEKLLQDSRVYSRVAQKGKQLSSTRSSTIDSMGWSYFSSLSLSDISNISVYGLLIKPAEIYNFKCYTSEQSRVVHSNRFEHYASQLEHPGSGHRPLRWHLPDMDIKVCILGETLRGTFTSNYMSVTFTNPSGLLLHQEVNNPAKVPSSNSIYCFSIRR